jgi:hypothetical protein
MQYLLPFVPAQSKNAPMEAANPKQTVATSALQNFIASYTPIPVIDLPLITQATSKRATQKTKNCYWCKSKHEVIILMSHE